MFPNPDQGTQQQIRKPNTVSYWLEAIPAWRKQIEAG